MSTDTAATFQSLSEFTSQKLQETGVPGVALGVLYEGQVQTAGFGVTSAANPLPVTDETFFQIGSISKTFTATAIMRLVEMGKLALEEPVRRYLPEFCVADEDVSARVTMRHLLTHTAGWDGDLFLDTGQGDDALPRYLAAMTELPQVAPLGTLVSYNNAGYTVLGRLVEVATGQCFETAMKELVLGPLGLGAAAYDPRAIMTERFAVGHGPSPQGAKVARPWALPRALYPAGGLLCHVRDLLRYACFHLGDGMTESGERLLSEASLAALHTPQAPVWGALSCALSWWVDDAMGVRQVAHGGGTVGQMSRLTLVPERGLAVAVLTNAEQGQAVHGAVVQRALQLYLGVEPPPAPEPPEANPEALREYVGRYSRYGAEIEVQVLLNQLVGQMVVRYGFPTREVPSPPPPPPMALGLCERDRLQASGGGCYDVLRKPDGSVGWLRTSDRAYRRQA